MSYFLFFLVCGGSFLGLSVRGMLFHNEFCAGCQSCRRRSDCNDCYSETLTYQLSPAEWNDQDSEIDLLTVLITPHFYLSSSNSSMDSLHQLGNLTGNLSIFPANSLVGACRFCSLFSREEGNYDTMEKILIYENGSFRDFCQPHTTGFFCSECEDNYYRDMGLNCVRCNHLIRDWFILILSQFLSITAMFIILIVTNFSLVSGPLNASIFFAQMVSTTMGIDQEETPLVNITNSTATAYDLTAVYKFIYGPWNLEFGAPFIYKLCLFHKTSYLYYFLVQYVVALYPLLLVAIVAVIYTLNNQNVTVVAKCRNCFYCCIKRIPQLKQSSRNVLASFVLLAYTKFSWLSTLLLTPSNLYDYRNEKASTVLYLDPNISFMGSDHFAFALVGGICCFFIVLLPLILLFVRYKNVPKYFSFLNVLLEPFQRPFQDTTSEVQADGVQVDEVVEVRRNYSRMRSVTIKYLSYFRRSDYQWIPGIYFILRIVLLVVYLALTNYILRFVLQQIVCLFGALVFFLINPYPKKWNNKLDGFLFTMLALYNTLGMYQYYRSTVGKPLRLSIFLLQYFIIFFPAIWMTFYLFRYIWTHCRYTNENGRIDLRISHSSVHQQSGIVLSETSCRLKSSSDGKAYETF